MAKTVGEDRARQGRRGTQVLIVLVAALVLAVIAWIIAESYGESIDAQPTQQQTSQG
jgi:type II secretory pathway component PulK